MKKTLSMLLALALLLFSGCTQSNSTITDSTTTDEVKPITYQIYADISENVLINEAATEQTVIQDGSQLDFYVDTIETIQVEGDQADSRTVVVADETFEATKTRTYKNSYALSANPKLQAFGYEEEYTATDEDIEFSFRPNSDQLIGFLAYDRTDVEGSISKEDARKRADQILIQIYGEDAFNTYTHVVETRNSRFTHYKFFYCIAINGVPTIDRIAIGINMQGELFSINANNYGILSAYDNKVTEKQVLAAQTALIAALSPSYQIKGDGLAIDVVSGVCYLVVEARRETETGTIKQLFYINVN